MKLLQRLGLVKPDELVVTKETPEIKEPTNPSVLPLLLSDSNYLTHLNMVLKEANLPGPDFYEFYKAFKDNQKSPLTEEQNIRIVYNPFNQMGVTPKNLLESANHYLTKISEENAAFQAEVVQTRQTDVEGKKAEADKLLAENLKLSETMQANSVKAQTLRNEAITTEQNIIAESHAFNSAKDNVTAEINSLITKIKMYLHGED